MPARLTQTECGACRDWTGLIYVIQALSSKFRERRVARPQFMRAKTVDAAFLK
jgi:hypothetical protein